jgi:hypothetical protein
MIGVILPLELKKVYFTYLFTNFLDAVEFELVTSVIFQVLT